MDRLIIQRDEKQPEGKTKCTKLRLFSKRVSMCFSKRKCEKRGSPVGREDIYEGIHILAHCKVQFRERKRINLAHQVVGSEIICDQ